ncbi:hypothetical protein [Pseudomonas sp. RW405]|uniref:hypothetical protein n=1 Tax=Pseudomonas sp. RW405 TaxID=2202652 RepID=UPI000D72C9F0|nr:hypothetical protein [Pseudomonas sp. RW405]PWY43396.1 hypothetical protein DK184_01050 [Pseudomonas sp. RW405]
MNDLDKQRFEALRDVWRNPKADIETKLNAWGECFDLAEKHGVDVRALAAPYLEGMLDNAMAWQREAVAALDEGELTKEKLVKAYQATILAADMLRALRGSNTALDGVSTGNPP